MELAAQHGCITGKIHSENSAVAFASVKLEKTTLGTFSAADGTFIVKQIPSGIYDVTISSVGYVKKTISVKIEAGVECLELGNIELKEDIFSLNEVVVAPNLIETHITKSPVKVEVYKPALLLKAGSPTNLMQAVGMMNGLQEVMACGVCNTNSISINGLPGPYTALLIDGSPVYGNLAAVYGLNGIPLSMIDRIEVIKGPMSTLYGSEALAGVINVITKSADGSEKASGDIMGTTHRELFTNTFFSKKSGKTGLIGGIHYGRSRFFDDRNKDGFGDAVQFDRLAAFTKISSSLSNNRKYSIALKYYYEDRRNGVSDFLSQNNYKLLRGSDSIYGESIITHRAELFGSADLVAGNKLRLDYSLSHHFQDSYYGDAHYIASQQIGFFNLVGNKKKGSHFFTYGFTNRLQTYDDNTFATQDSTENGIINSPDNQWIKGVFVQNDWDISEKLSMSAGIRTDHYFVHGVIPAPRLSFKYSPSMWSTFRINYGTGFRIVNLFTEDHAFVTGQRKVILEEKLNPERSQSVMINWNAVISGKKYRGNLDADVFATQFSNIITPDYENAGEIRYANSPGGAYSMGASLTFSQQFDFPFSYRVGITYLNTQINETSETGEIRSQPLNYAPSISGNGIFTWNWKKKNIDFTYSTRLIGPMHLPAVYDTDKDGSLLQESRPLTSKTYSLHTIQINYFSKNKKSEFFCGIKNLLDFIQPITPLTGYNDPNHPTGFSPHFDTAYNYAGLLGREFFLGVRWKL
jgi:outer membrane receptor for ferrienterochelin and colicins